MIAAWLLAAAAGQSAAAVPHPDIPCWTGERSWTGPGEPVSEFVSYDTDAEPLAVTIEHRRDHFRERGGVRENYNFLDYRFPSRPGVRARAYLPFGEAVLVSVDDLRTITSLAALRRVAGDEVVCYLQKRFERIETPSGNRGYQPVWQAGASPPGPLRRP